MASIHEMLDAYILSAVLAYSAIHSTYTSSCTLLSLTSSLVLLINSHYLHAPIHLPSTLLALIVLLIPIRTANFSHIVVHISHALQLAPHFLLELLIAFLLFGSLVLFAFVKPWRKAVTERRQPTPIAPAPQQPRIVQGEDVLRQARDVLDAPNVPMPATGSAEDARVAARMALSMGGDETDQVEKEDKVDMKKDEGQSANDDSTQGKAEKPAVAAEDEARKGERGQDQVAQGKAVKPAPPRRSPLTPKETFAPPPRPRRRRVTQSQRLAASILAEQRAEAERMEAARERAQMMMELAARSAREEREERRRREEELKRAIEEAEEQVKRARERLRELVVEADRAREGRRRAGDQVNVCGSEENERELDKAVEKAKVAEGRESVGIREVNEARARVVQLREELSRLR